MHYSNEHETKLRTDSYKELVPDEACTKHAKHAQNMQARKEAEIGGGEYVLRGQAKDAT